MEVKSSDTKISPALEYFRRGTGAAHAFHVVLNADYVDVDCFSYDDSPPPRL